MKKIYLLLLLLPFFLSGCKTKNSKNVTTDHLKGTVWVSSSFGSGLTNLHVLTFKSATECDVLATGTTVHYLHQCNYKIDNNKIIITPFSGHLAGNGTYECTIKKDELLMYWNFLDAKDSSPNKFIKIPVTVD